MERNPSSKEARRKENPWQKSHFEGLEIDSGVCVVEAYDDFFFPSTDT